jgi:hypothetical protein
MIKKEIKKVISIRLDTKTIAEIKKNRYYTSKIRELITEYIKLQNVV